MVKKTTGVMLMAVVMMFVAAAPLVQSETDSVHEIVKDENGPPSTCALTWEFVAPSDGTWAAHVTNNGMRWLILDMIDVGTSEVLIDREMYRYAVWGNEFTTEALDVVGGHTYSITGTPNGALWTSCTVEDVFVPDVVPEPPVAMFEVSIDGATVSVDASGSYDPDSTDPLEFVWDWGDGSAPEAGVTASHTYVPPETYVAAPSSVKATPFPPYSVFGYITDDVGAAVVGAEVTITNTNTGDSAVVLSDSVGFYTFDIRNELPSSCASGDLITVEVVKDTLVGSAEGVVDLESIYPFLWLDIELEGSGPVSWDVTITLTVTDSDGLSTTVSKTVTLTA